MQRTLKTVKRTEKENVRSKELKEESATTSKKIAEEKSRSFVATTPRSFTQRSASDLYNTQNAKKKMAAPAKTPRKVGTSAISTASPMKDLLKAKSTASLKLTPDRKYKAESKNKSKEEKVSQNGSTKPKMAPFNVTVNSPTVKRKLVKEFEDTGDLKTNKSEQRQRQNTKTLTDDEVKVLTPDSIDNNAEMARLTIQLKARPKSFYVDLKDGETEKKISKQSKKPQDTPQKNNEEDENDSYEDDFESYESDFESYHSPSDESNDVIDDIENSDDDDDKIASSEGDDGEKANYDKDDEKMLDSGSYELRDAQKSANRSRRTIMDFIQEDTELKEDRKALLSDEGFQDMSSAHSSMKNTDVDVLERPLFIDFKKSKEMKMKREKYERQKRRAKDLLDMISLHEMTYSLFEMTPISYDQYMASYGRSNYVQIATQTLEDRIESDTQTDDVTQETKWTQFPVEFSKNDVVISKENGGSKRKSSDLDYLKKFTFMLNVKEDEKVFKEMDEELRNNALRLYFEQKDGVGSDVMLLRQNYEDKMKNASYNSERLMKFLKRSERKIGNVLSLNAGKTEANLVKTTKLSFSKGFTLLDYKNITETSDLHTNKITNLIFSQTKSNFLLTIHDSEDLSEQKCLMFLWDLSLQSSAPLKTLASIENIDKLKFKGDANGVVVSALKDGSIHVWDLSEEATCSKNVANNDNPAENVGSTADSIDSKEPQKSVHASSYTCSATAMVDREACDEVAGLELVDDCRVDDIGARRIQGQVCSLQNTGILTIWLIIQERNRQTEKDVGRAYWSKIRLEKKQRIVLTDYFDAQPNENGDFETNFNLTTVKRRLLSRKCDRTLSRQNSAVTDKFERPASAARLKKRLQEVEFEQNWNTSLFCTDLKVLEYNQTQHYLVSRNCGEVLRCTRSVGVVRLKRICVTSDKSTITTLAISNDKLPYFLAASETGTLHLCSLLECRVLLTLDCRNSPQEIPDKCFGDHKGRFVSSGPAKPAIDENSLDLFDQTRPSSIYWSKSNPCSIITLTTNGAICSWDLSRSDIYPKTSEINTALACAESYSNIVILTPLGDVEIHRMNTDKVDNVDLFKKYVALL